MTGTNNTLAPYGKERHVEAKPKHRMAVKIEKFTCLKEKSNSEGLVNYALTNELDSFATAQNDYSGYSERQKSIILTISPRPLWERDRVRGKKIAFTLAEVLITLGIIGVVAAMTMPVLIQKYQNIVLENQFKKSYSMLSQALNKIYVDNDMSIPVCYYNFGSITATSDSGARTSDCVAVKEQFLKNLRVIKTCEDNSYKNGCIPKYEGFDTMMIEKYPDLSEEEALDKVRYVNGFWQNAILNVNASHVLADGSIILEYRTRNYLPILFAIDINGKKGPNKWGYDLFSFFTVSDELKYHLQGTRYAVEKGGKTTAEMLIKK